VLDIAEYGIQSLHSIDDLKGLRLADLRSFVSEQEKWQRIVLQNAVDEALFLDDGPNQFSLVLSIHDQRPVAK
jgi:hypothetical protein